VTVRLVDMDTLRIEMVGLLIKPQNQDQNNSKGIPSTVWIPGKIVTLGF